MPGELGIRYNMPSSNPLGDAWGGFKNAVQTGGDAAIDATVNFSRNFIQGMMDDEAEAVEKRRAGGWTQKLQELQDTAGIMLEGATAGPLDLGAEVLIQGSNYLPEKLKTPAIAAGLLLGSVDGTVPKVKPKILTKVGITAPKLTKHSDDLVKWYLKGDMSPKLKEATKSINPKGYQIWQGTYKDYKALSAKELKSSVNRSGMSPQKFKEKYGVPIYEHRGELKLGRPKSHDVLKAQLKGGINRSVRTQPPSLEELTPIMEELGIPLKYAKEYSTNARQGFARVQNLAKELSSGKGKAGEQHAGHLYNLLYGGDAVKGAGKMGTTATSGRTAVPELARSEGGEELLFNLRTKAGNLNRGASGDINKHAADMAGIPRSWEEDLVQWWAHKNNMNAPNYKAYWTNEQRTLIEAIPENWKKAKVEVMMERIRAIDDAGAEQLNAIRKDIAIRDIGGLPDHEIDYGP